MRRAEYSQPSGVPTEGLRAWAGPDGSAAPAANLDPGLDVMLIEFRADWAHVRCSNGWEAWGEGRRLVVLGPAPAPCATPRASRRPQPPPPPSTAPPQPGPPSAAWVAPGAAAPPPGVPRPTAGF